jgi:D-lactate dehydrogenase (cytochrome)
MKGEHMNCRTITGKDTVLRSYSDYLRDESRLTGEAVEHIYFPETTEDIIAAVKDVIGRSEALTISGSRTGIVGGAVPAESENLLSLEALKGDILIGFDREWFARMPANVRLETLTRYLREGAYVFCDETSARKKPDGKLYYPVDPTEATASIGGMVATNASGARSYFYGSTRQWVRALTVILPDGHQVHLKRGEYISKHGVLTVPHIGAITLPVLEKQHRKNTAGYYLTREMDAVDLFIGSEGTLGIIAEVEVRLIPEPSGILAQFIYFKSDQDLLAFIDLVRGLSELKPVALEYFDENTLRLLRKKRAEDGGAGSIPIIPASAGVALYIETIFDDDAGLEKQYEYFETSLALAHSSLEMSWAGVTAREIETMKAVRHAVPEEVNAIIARKKKKSSDIHKISTDMAVEDHDLDWVLAFYKKRLREVGIDFVIFGHIGDNHLHVNMLPDSAEELSKAKELYREFARAIVARGGTVAAEHGLGRLKRDLLSLQYPQTIVQVMRQIKKVFDPHGRLNPGVML